MIKRLEDKELLDSIYGYAYKRCANSHEAEDLCSEIILAILKCKTEPEKPNAYIWTVAHGVYADFCEKRSKQNNNVDFDSLYEQQGENNIQSWTENSDDETALKQILQRIAYLSELYRNVMIMYYLDGLKISEISLKLGVSENVIKQRLFSARQVIKSEVMNMDTNNDYPSLKPIRFIAQIGTGNPCDGNDPRENAHRLFSQNLIYLCKDKERNAQELAEIMQIPMLYVEEELEIQSTSGNGNGMLRKLPNGKYINNVPIVDYEDQMAIFEVLKQHYQKFADMTAEMYISNQEKMMNSDVFINKPRSFSQLIWVLAHHRYWGLIDMVNQKLEECFEGQEKADRPFFMYNVAGKPEQNIDLGFYGCDGTNAYDVCGYKHVFFSNIYGRRLKKHFWAGWNISGDASLRMLIKSTKGLSVGDLSESEREIAAKAIEEGYILREDDMLKPAVMVLDHNNRKIWDLNWFDYDNVLSLADDLSKETVRITKKYLSKHLMSQYHKFTHFCTEGGVDILYEALIKKGIIEIPEKTPGSDGVILELE